MNLLLCHNYYQQPGGEDQVFEDEARLLESRGHTVVRYTRHNDDVKSMAGLQVARNTFWNRQTYDEITCLVRQHAIELVHCANIFPLISPAVYAAARDAGAAVVQTLHNYRLVCPAAQLLRDGRICTDCTGKRFAWPAIAHGCYRGSRCGSAVVAAMLAWHHSRGTWHTAVDQYIALTRAAREQLVAGGLPAERIVVKPNFIDPDPGLGPGDGDHFAFVGRLSPEKGIETLLAAWSLMPPTVRLKIIGDGPLSELVSQAAESSANIEWLGRRPWPEVLPLVGSARALVMPSIWYEPFGRTVIEAFATGTPVIASRIGSLGELVEHHRSGLLFEPGSAPGLAEAVLRFAQQCDRAVMGQTAREVYQENYTADANYPQLISTYQQALERRHGVASSAREHVPAGAAV